MGVHSNTLPLAVEGLVKYVGGPGRDYKFHHPRPPNMWILYRHEKRMEIGKAFPLKSEVEIGKSYIADFKFLC